MTGKDDFGKFTHGNHYASIGGRRRAERLTPERRRAIARAGWLARLAKHYDGDVTEAARAIARAGNGSDALFFGHTLTH